MNRAELSKKISIVTSELLHEKGYISFPDVFVRLGYLAPADFEAWRFRKIPYLERAIKTNLSKIAFILDTIRKNATNGNLKPSQTVYTMWGKGQREILRFSKSGNPYLESVYSTRYLKTKQIIMAE